MSRPGPCRRCGDKWRIVWRQLAAGAVHTILVDAVQPQIGGIHKLTARIAGNHVRVRAVMIADGKTPLRCGCRARRASRALILMHIYRLAQTTVLFHRQHRDRPAHVVGDQKMTTVRRQGEIDRPRAAGGHLIQAFKLAVRGDTPRLHHAFFHLTGGIQRLAVRADGKLRDVGQGTHQRFIV